MLAVLLASPASSAGVHEAEIEGTGGRSHQDVLPSCDMGNALATHTEPSAKLITAHKRPTTATAQLVPDPGITTVYN